MNFSNPWIKRDLQTKIHNELLIHLLSHYGPLRTVAIAMILSSKLCLSADEKIIEAFKQLDSFETRDKKSGMTKTTNRIPVARSLWSKANILREAALRYNDPAIFPPLEFCAYLAVVLGSKMKSRFFTDDDTLELTTPKDLSSEELSEWWWPQYHFQSYRCISDYGNNDTYWRVYVCIEDTDTHKKGTVIEMDHWDYLMEDMPDEDPTATADDDDDGDDGKDAAETFWGPKKVDEPSLVRWPYTIDEGDQMVMYPFRGPHDREPMVFCDMVRFMQSVARCPERRKAVSYPIDSVPWYEGGCSDPFDSSPDATPQS